MSTLIAITYDDLETGQSAFNALGEMQKMKILELEDAAFASKDEKGKVKVKDTLEQQMTGASASWGFFWGFLIGLIFLELATSLWLIPVTPATAGVALATLLLFALTFILLHRRGKREGPVEGEGEGCLGAQPYVAETS